MLTSIYLFIFKYFFCITYYWEIKTTAFKSIIFLLSVSCYNQQKFEAVGFWGYAIKYQSIIHQLYFCFLNYMLSKTIYICCLYFTRWFQKCVGPVTSPFFLVLIYSVLNSIKLKKTSSWYMAPCQHSLGKFC